MMRTWCRADNVSADRLVESQPELLDLARPHIPNLRGVTVDEAHRYAIDHNVNPLVLFVAHELAGEADRLLGDAT